MATYYLESYQVNSIFNVKHYNLFFLFQEEKQGALQPNI